ncbi:conserved protein of unknown function [Paraburkholderia kururiensis]
MHGRAERRAQRARLKAKRRQYQIWSDAFARPDVWLGSYVDTPTPCSCWMCGNPRHHFHERTIQERRWRQEIDDEQK